MTLGYVYDVIVSTIVTEKTNLQLSNNKLVLEVLPSATKHDVKKAVETVFSLEVDRVNITIIPGKTKRFKGVKGVRKSTKKAVVSLKKGQKLDLTKLEIGK
ncbi:MAG: 50S ribosomal protein L23 [Rickettsiales bacterium]|jgi:large subunit ribosomal protein L23|nr:50S ribosomal protein L23 [Rickettsiales bacterium]